MARPRHSVQNRKESVVRIRTFSGRKIFRSVRFFGGSHKELLRRATVISFRFCASYINHVELNIQDITGSLTRVDIEGLYIKNSHVNYELPIIMIMMSKIIYI